jgi:hypothetical protein
VNRNWIFVYQDIDGKFTKAFFCKNRAMEEIYKNNYMGKVLGIVLDPYDCRTVFSMNCHHCHDCAGGE